MIDYDSWKLDSPREGKGCVNCGEETDNEEYCDNCLEEHSCPDCQEFIKNLDDFQEVVYSDLDLSRRHLFVCKDCSENMERYVQVL